jgi:hypothetical protein
VLERPRRGYAGAIAAIAGAIVLVAGAIVGVVLATRSSSSGSSQAQVTQTAHRQPQAKRSQPPAHVRTVTTTTPSGSQTPVAYAHYGASSSGGYSARLPADPGWTVEPEQNQNGPGESPLWRTIVDGPSGAEIWIDYTSDQPAGDPGGVVTSTVPVPGFATVANGHEFNSCSNFGQSGPCIDYITQIQGGTGIAVLGFGGDPDITASVAKRIASSLGPSGE